MGKKYFVDLKSDEQKMLTGLIASGIQRVQKINHARILLKADDGWTDQKISEALNVSVATIERKQQYFVQEGIQQALSPRKTQLKYQHLMDGVQEATYWLWHAVNLPKGIGAGVCFC